MKYPIITVDGKKISMKKLTVEDWVEMAEVYDEIQAITQNSVKFIELHCKMIEMAFELTREEINKMSIEDIIPIYVDITVALKEVLTSKFEGDEKKSLTETEI